MRLFIPSVTSVIPVVIWVCYSFWPGWGISETAVAVPPADDSAALAELVQPDGAVVGTVIADDENEAATTSQPGENTAEHQSTHSSSQSTVTSD